MSAGRPRPADRAQNPRSASSTGASSKGASPKSTGGPTPIGDTLRSLLREIGASSGGRDQTVFRAWERVTGLGQRAVPVRLRAGELSVEVSSATLLQELKNFTGESLRQRLNRDLGNEVVSKLVFRLRS